jgi:hypothetical protein
MQAVRWIKAREGKALDGKVKTFSDADFLKQLELAVTYGSAFLFEGCDEYIDPVIDPVLEKALTRGRGGKLVCSRLGGLVWAGWEGATFGQFGWRVARPRGVALGSSLHWARAG